MNKRIFCLCLILIALMGISVVSACPADNCTDEMSLYGSCWIDPEQSMDSMSNHGVSWVDPEHADEPGFKGGYEANRSSISKFGVSWVDPEQALAV